MNFNKYLWRLAVFFCILIAFQNSGFAILNITLPKALTPNNIDLFWSGDSTTPDQTGKVISPDNTIDLSEASPGKPFGGPSPFNVYQFWSGKNLPSEKSTGLRLWDGDKGKEGTVYTDVQAWGNSSGGVDSQVFGNPFAYIAAKATKPTISKYSDTGTTYVDPVNPSSRSVTFTSVQPASGKYAVQVKEATWNINGKDVVGGTDLKLETPAYSMDPGTTYVVKVKHKSYWGDYSAYSDPPVTYSVGKGGTGVGGSFTFNLKAFDATKLIVNAIASPADIANASVLAATINKKSVDAKGPDNIVVAIAHWTADKSEIYVVKDKSGVDFKIAAGEGLQVFTTVKLDNLVLP